MRARSLLSFATVPPPPPPRFVRIDWLILATLAVVTLALYARTVTFDFVNYDDDQYAYENDVVLDGLTWHGVKWAFTTGEASNWHPLTWLSLMADVNIFGEGSGGHHATNSLLHAANAAATVL